ncbi:MAG: C39 family peptidase [Eubacterium sp.]|nr:C39 family peptidase [Eubacterium sp.]
MRTSFQDIPGKNKRCFYDEKGHRVHGKQKIYGDECYFNKKTGRLESRIMDITYIHQSHGVWKNGQWTHREITSARSYSGSPLRYSACGLCSCAMAVTAITHKLVLPTHLNSKMCGYTGGGYSTHPGVPVAKKYGLSAKLRSLTKKELIDQLFHGRYVVVWVFRSIYGGGGNNQGGDTGATGHSHMVLIHGYKNGKFAIADPNNLSQSYVPRKNLKYYSTFNNHLARGKDRSYCVITKKLDKKKK